MSEFWQPRQRLDTVWHEAGHAVIGTLLGIEVLYVAVQPDQVLTGDLRLTEAPYNGVCCFHKDWPDVKARVFSKYAGECTHMARDRVIQDPSDSDDWLSAKILDPKHCVKDYVSLTLGLCRRHMPAIEAVAHHLNRNTSRWPLSGQRIREIVKRVSS